MYPRYSEICTPLLREIEARGGSTRPSDEDAKGRTVYEALADYFNLTLTARTAPISETDARSKWENMVQWSRNDLRKKGLIDNKERGVWTVIRN